MAVTLLRGKDAYRRQLFWNKIAGEGKKRLPFKGNFPSLVNVLTTPHLFGNCVYYVDDQKLITEATDFLIHNAISHTLVIDQKDRHDDCYRRLARKFEVITCDPIWAYKIDDVIDWIYETAATMGVSISYSEAKLLLDNLGEESLEIVRVLEIHKLTGEDISKLVEYDTSKALLVVIDSIARRKIDSAVKALIFLQYQGVEFTQVAYALLTRYELFLKIKCCRLLRLSDEDIKMRLKLSRMIAGNVLAEAEMNNFEWCIRFMKNLTVNAMSSVGYEYLILTLLSL